MQAPNKSYFRTHLIPECYNVSFLNNNKTEVLKLLAEYITDPGNRSTTLLGLTNIQATLPPESKVAKFNPPKCSTC